MYITIKSLWERHKNKSLIAKMTGHDWKTVAKKIKRTRSSSPSYFLSCFFGEKTKPRGITDARKGSQTGAGQGREDLDNTCAYACRVGGESTAVFPPPYTSPLMNHSLTLFFFADKHCEWFQRTNEAHKLTHFSPYPKPSSIAKDMFPP